MKVRWNEIEEPVLQGCDPQFNLDNLVITVREAATGKIMQVRHTAATCHPNGDKNLEIKVDPPNA